MIEAYYILDPESEGQHDRSMAAIGPFATLAATEKYLRDDARETYLDSDSSLRDGAENWATPMLIVKLVRAVRQVPVVSVKVELREVAQ